MSPFFPHADRPGARWLRPARHFDSRVLHCFAYRLKRSHAWRLVNILPEELWNRVSFLAGTLQVEMLTTPFLTDLDTRAAVKGSRDPLGIQSIWTRFGRHVVGNLTTVSDSIRDFTTLLLGYHFAESLADETDSGSELAVFLRWEQLAAYSRAAVNQETGFRGTERVWKNLNEGKPRRVVISDDRAQQILGNQKIYGLWGLYTMPARASGLLHGTPTRLTPPAREMVQETYIPLLEDGGGRDIYMIKENKR